MAFQAARARASAPQERRKLGFGIYLARNIQEISKLDSLARRPIAATNQISEIIADPFHEGDISFEDATIRLRRQVATWRIFEQVL